MTADHLEHDGRNAAQHRKYLIDTMLFEDEVPLSTVKVVFNLTDEEVAIKQKQLDEDAADKEAEEEPFEEETYE